jgi:hypothetical protein
MKKLITVLLFVVGVGSANAQSIDPVSLVIAKVIKALDLKVQKLQNEIIWLQQAQSAAENELSRVKLSEIRGWQQQFTDLYANYFDELRKVKGVVAGLGSVKKIVDMQRQVVFEYGRMAMEPLMKTQYDAMLNTSMDILQTLYGVLSSQYSMKDAERICMITTLKDAMGHCLSTVQLLNRQQVEAASARARLQADLQFVKKLNGIQ